MKAKLHELKYLLVNHAEAYAKFLKKVYCFKKQWMPHTYKDVFSGGLHTYNRTAAIMKALGEPIPLERKSGMSEINRKGKDRQSNRSTSASLLSSTTQENELKDTTISLQTLLKHVKIFEEMNETFHFKFDGKNGKKAANALINGAYYICIKKAFTPYATLHMLKQIQIAALRKDDVKLEEVKPLVHYRLSVPNLCNEEKGLDFPDSVYEIKGAVTSRALREMKCDCGFYTNFGMICWH